jgi:hypothetical protein
MQPVAEPNKPVLPNAYGVTDALPPLRFAIEKIQTFLQFFTTFRLLLRGDHLWDNTPAETDELRVLGPWKFNLYQSLFSAAFAAFTVSAFGTLFHPEGWNASVTDSFVKGLIIPLSLAINAYVAAHAIVGSDQKDSLDRAVRAFLYLDGVVGFFSQTIGATLTALFFAAPESTRFALSINPAVLISVVVVAGLQLYATQVAIPSRLFKLFDQPSSGSGRRRWLTFQVLTLVSAAAAIQVIVVIINKFSMLYTFVLLKGDMLWGSGGESAAQWFGQGGFAA